MKSYTDIEQSKKLVKILPIESADMRYGYIAPYEYSDRMFDGGYDEVPYQKDFLKRNPNFSENEYDGEFSCWSLSALLGVLDIEINSENGEIYQLNIEKDGTLWNVSYKELYNRANPIETESTEELVDACVEMILNLHKQKLL